MNKKILCAMITLIIIFSVVAIREYVEGRKENNNMPVVRELKEYDDNDFNLRLIKTVNSGYQSNYLISPYSIEIALNMLKEGADNNTLKEIESVISKRNISDVTTDKVKVANAVFIKNQYKNYIEKSFYDNLKNNYNSDVLYDNFSTPKVINEWVSEKTDKMIPKLLNDISKDFVLGLANAVAIDVNWLSEFECINTLEREFTKVDGSLVNVEMMHKTFSNRNYKYFDNEESKGIVIPYKEGLEFVGILPNNSVDEYINNMSKDTFNNIDSKAKEASEKLHILLSLPRFSYSFDLENFKNVLQSMGIKDAFDKYNSDFTNIISKDNLDKSNIERLYVSTAVHKTYIDLNEKGTKAAAVTYFGMAKATAMLPTDYEEVKIEFNKPFIYAIKDTKTNEILFFGVVYEPNIWNGSTCKNV